MNLHFKIFHVQISDKYNSSRGIGPESTAGIESVLCVDALGPIESESVVALE